jgi:hypothetical protein
MVALASQLDEANLRFGRAAGLEAEVHMDIDINSPNPNKRDEGVITTQRIVPGKGIERVRDDLFRKPDAASEVTMDDSPECLDKEDDNVFRQSPSL